MDLLKDLLAIIGVVLSGIPQGLFALTFGFGTIPTALAFAVGAVANTLLGSVTPISFQAETVALAGTMGKNMRERLSMIFFAGSIMLGIGLLGLLEVIVDFIGPEITNGMMTGVGLMLVKVSLDLFKSHYRIGIVSVLSATATYMFTNDLIYTIVVSVICSTIAAKIVKYDSQLETNAANEGFKFKKPIFNTSVLRGALSLVCLTIGGNIAFGKITGEIANQAVNVDHVTIVSALADMSSSMFGGAPVATIISATGSAPHPVFAGVMMMVIMAIILASGLLPKLSKIIPTQSVAGFLLILGAFVTLPSNAPLAMTGEYGLAGAVTMAVTTFTDPFVGMMAGLLVKTLTMFV